MVAAPFAWGGGWRVGWGRANNAQSSAIFDSPSCVLIVISNTLLLLRYEHENISSKTILLLRYEQKNSLTRS